MRVSTVVVDDLVHIRRQCICNRRDEVGRSLRQRRQNVEGYPSLVRGIHHSADYNLTAVFPLPLKHMDFDNDSIEYFSMGCW